MVYIPKSKTRKGIVCPVCNGAGKVKVKGDGEKEIPCPRCEGRGYI